MTTKPQEAVLVSPTIYRKDYLPPSFRVVTVELMFDLYDEHALLTNHMSLQRAYSGELRLHGDGLELVSLAVNDQLVGDSQYHLESGDLVMDAPGDTFTITVVTKLYPQANTELSGLYRSHHMFCTQCESQGFRRMTFFPDRPDVLSVYTTMITADSSQYPILLSNGNLEASGRGNDGRHWAKWHDPFPKPSYLFALVAGNLACVADEFETQSGKKVALQLYVEQGNEDLCAHALTSLKHAMRWDEEQYGREYDLSVFMIVAVSDFNMGAMENKGLNIFNSKYILARPDTATDDDYAAIESVVAHEYFHNWTGNRVTCRDWFQLSLKEGLTVFRDQEFSRDMNSRDVCRIVDVKQLRQYQFPEDSGSMAHPVRPDAYQEISNFYTATVYEKGAEVIRMQHRLLGPKGFRRGMDLYFERHDGQAVTIDDFVAAMEDANHVDLTQFKRWYSQKGTPVVTVTSLYHEGRLTLTLNQQMPGEQVQPLHIPIALALLDEQGAMITTSLIELRDVSEVYHFEGLPHRPIVSLLRDFSAPVILKTDASSAQLLAQLRHDSDGFSRWDAAQTLMRDTIVADYDKKSDVARIKETIFEVLGELVTDEHLDPALRAELITPPSFEDLASAVPLVDVERLEAARLAFVSALSQALYDKLAAIFASKQAQAPQQSQGLTVGWRKLRLSCLYFMRKAQEQVTLPLCQTLLATGKTMTEQLAGLTGLVNSQNALARQEAIDTFYCRWSEDELVMNKWFMVQATADYPGVLAQVQSLLSHPFFHIQNPNNVMALIGGFTKMNPRHFHAPDGQGYQFLADQLLVLDAINPQVSSRMAVPFTRWQRLDHQRQALMQAQLARLATHPLSKDLAELVSKSLS